MPFRIYTAVTSTENKSIISFFQYVHTYPFVRQVLSIQNTWMEICYDIWKNIALEAQSITSSLNRRGLVRYMYSSVKSLYSHKNVPQWLFWGQN